MVTMPYPPATTDPHPHEPRPAIPLLAASSLCSAAIALVGVGLIGRYLGASAYVWLMFLNAAVVLLGALLGALGAVSPAARTPALLLTWNGLGVSLSLLALGLFSLGALIVLPIILIAIGLSAWPRAEGESLVSGPALIALAGGCLFLPAAYGMIAFLDWLAGVAG